ncbi:MAG: RNA polymerase sigma-70 factor [Tannerellaceae bacterium]|jgi:RNA polymerase sigma-70 factor (ECF subfamily)|nr:RNA polymerase sigma-70 factor [Tannerellaceae bacterium]
MSNDLFVLRKIKDGDIGRFETVFRLYYTPLCLFAAGITGRTDVSEEIVQDMFYMLWKERERIRIFHSIRSYLYGGVRNRSLQYCEHREVVDRHRQSVIREPEGIYELREPYGPDPSDMLEYKELESLINHTLDRLPERRRRIFRMHRFEGMRYAEIAAVLSLSVKTVEAEMTKALQTLRKEIENYTRIA